MGGELVLKIFRSTLLAAVVLLLWMAVRQADRTEKRVIGVEAAVRETERKVDEALKATRRVAEELRERPAVASRESEPREGGGEARDPRTLPFWPAPDNILTDLTHEPAPPSDAPRGGTLTYYTQSNPRSLNRLVYNEAELAERICGPVYEYLAPRSKANPDQYVPGLANRVTVNADFTEFTCYIRKGMTWHVPWLTDEERAGALAWLAAMPPQPVTAHDVKFTFDVVRDPQSECGALRTYIEDLESYELLDDYTIRFRWKRPSYYNKDSLLYTLMIYPEFLYERDQAGGQLPGDRVTTTFPQHWFNLKMCGTGPFRLAEFKPNQYIRLQRNDAWWDPRKPALDEIYIHIQEDYDVLLAMFKKGQLDLFSPLPAQYRAEVLEKGDIFRMQERGEATVKLWEMFTYYYVGWNLRNPVLAERDVRRALGHLFPKERVIRDIYFGLAVPHDGPVHPWESSYVKDLEKFEFDPKKAAAILDAAGWTLNARGVREKVVNGERRELTIKVLHATQGTLGRDIVDLFGKSAQTVGIVFEARPREWSVMTKMLEDKDFDACVLGWANSWDSDPSQIWHSDSARAAKGSNHVSYMNPELDGVIDSLKTEFDGAKRKLLWERFQRIIVGDQPYCFTLIRTRSWFVNNRMGNLYFNKLRPQDWFLPWIVK
ncbi:MAG: ABC transporter substrate-binding protein [Planctomycetaceae bacterium]